MRTFTQLINALNPSPTCPPPTHPHPLTHPHLSSLDVTATSPHPPSLSTTPCHHSRSHTLSCRNTMLPLTLLPFLVHTRCYQENIADLKYWIETIDFVNATSVSLPMMTSIDIHTFIAAAAASSSSSSSSSTSSSSTSNTYNHHENYIGNGYGNGNGNDGDGTNNNNVKIKGASGGSLDGEILTIVDHVAQLVMIEYDDLLTSSVKGKQQSLSTLNYTTNAPLSIHLRKHLLTQRRTYL